jgi:hypothetical protein
MQLALPISDMEETHGARFLLTIYIIRQNRRSIHNLHIKMKNSYNYTHWICV